jgi:hypothetical protein
MLRQDCSSNTKTVSVVRMEQRKEDSQSLENTESTKPKVRAKHREKAVKESGWPANFRQEKDNNLEDDEKAVNDGPENTPDLVGHGAVPVVACQ